MRINGVYDGIKIPVPMLKRGAALVLAAIVVGCSIGDDEELSVPEQIEDIGAGAKADAPRAAGAAVSGELVGMSREALRACAGAPQERFATDPSVGLEQWVYQTEPAAQGASDRYCKAVFSLNKGQVANVTFTRRDGTRVEDMAQCSALIDPCRSPQGR